MTTNTKFFLLFLVAFAFTCAIIQVRDGRMRARLAEANSMAHTSKNEFHAYAFLCNDLPGCFRVGSAIPGEVLQRTLALITFPLFRHMEEKLSSAHASFLFRWLCLFFIPFFLWQISKNFLLTLFSSIAAFSGIAGWGLGQVNRFELFTQNLIFYDYASAAFLFFLFAYLLPSNRPLWRSIGVLALGQLIFENLGFIAGVSIACLDTWQSAIAPSQNPIKEKLSRLGVYFTKRLALFGAASVFITAIVYLLLYLANDSLGWVTQNGHMLTGFDAYGKQNIKDLFIIRQNIQFIFGYAAFFSFLIGTALYFCSFFFDKTAAMCTEPTKKNYRLQECRYDTILLSLVIINLAFFLTICVGVFVSGLIQELGRQVVPIVAFFSFTVVYCTFILLNRLRNILWK